MNKEDFPALLAADLIYANIDGMLNMRNIEWNDSYNVSNFKWSTNKAIYLIKEKLFIPAGQEFTVGGELRYEKIILL